MEDDLDARDRQTGLSSAFFLYMGGAVQTGPFFNVIHPALHLSSASSATFQGPLQNCLGYAIVASDVSKPWQLPPFHKPKEVFLRTCPCCYLTTDKVIGLAVFPGNPKHASIAFGFKGLDSTRRLSQLSSFKCLINILKSLISCLKPLTFRF